MRTKGHRQIGTKVKQMLRVLAVTCGLLPAALWGLWGTPIGVGMAEEATDFGALPVSGVVTMIDLGAKKCIPCRKMAPILERVAKKYRGKAAVVFIDVWVNREQARRFGVRAIPTQIFFDASGAEVYRHVGFMDEEQIAQVMEKLGVEI